MPIQRRQELLRWAMETDNRYIIEDEYDSEFRFSGQMIPTLQSIDKHEKVIYMNTFTKTLSSTVRMAYMVLPNHLAREFNKKLSFYSSPVSNFEQLTLAAFISEGYFEKHINRMRTYYRAQRNKLIECISNHPQAHKITILEENAGLHFLLKVKTILSDEKIMQKAKEKGLRLSFLANYTMRPETYKSTIIINYSGLDPQKMEEAINRLYTIL